MLLHSCIETVLCLTNVRSLVGIAWHTVECRQRFLKRLGAHLVIVASTSAFYSFRYSLNIWNTDAFFVSSGFVLLIGLFTTLQKHNILTLMTINTFSLNFEIRITEASIASTTPEIGLRMNNF